MEYWGIKTWNRLLRGRCSDKIRILSELAGLSLRQTQILWLSFCQPRKLASWEIADRLCISERTLRYEKNSALRLIQELCEANCVSVVSGDYFFDLARKAGIPEYMAGWKPLES